MAPYKAVIFDWAGTTIDFGSFAPMGVFVETFAKFGIEVSVEQARAPNGMPKRDHIAAMMADPEIAVRWASRFGQKPRGVDIDRIYEVFLPLNERVAAKYATLVPGVSDAVESLRGMGMKIGSTTGYTRSIMAYVLPVAADHGYSPDNVVCSDDLIEGRPGPLGI